MSERVLERQASSYVSVYDIFEIRLSDAIKNLNSAASKIQAEYRDSTYMRLRIDEDGCPYITVHYNSPETPEEVAAREEAALAQKAARKLMYENLKKEFGDT